MLRVGFVNYMNSLPFHAAFTLGALKPPATLTFEVPTKLNQALRGGELDVSFLSAAEYLKHQQAYELLPGLCIGARDRVASVCVYVRHSIQRLNGAVVGLTPQSASSANLLRILCKHFWKVEPRFQPMNHPEDFKNCEGVLLIGDDCLAKPQLPSFTTIDLAQAWYYCTGLPFTFAVFAARREVVRDQSSELEQLQYSLQEALSWARRHPEEIEKLALSRNTIDLATLREYYSLLRYDLDDEQQQGLQHFAELLESTHDLISLS